MSIINASPLLGAGADGYQIERSLRFNSADSAYLNRTPASAGNQTTWTWSGWLKRAALTSGGNFTLFSAGNALQPYTLISFTSDQLAFDAINAGSVVVGRKYTTQVFRDSSAWYHLVLTWDTTNGTAADRMRMYVNGVRVTSFSLSSDPASNATTQANTTAVHYVGAYPGGGNYFDGYLTEIHFIDGQALTPSSFGETDTITGVWKPKKYTGTYGTNGFYLKFADNSGTTSTTLGKDSSGNGNNWTPNNFSVTAGAGNDSMIDTPTPYADGGNGRGNYATLSPLSKGDDATLSNGNLDVAYGSAPFPSCTMATFGMSSGKWYWETTITASSLAATGAMLGVTNISNSSYNVMPQYPGYNANGWAYHGNNGSKYTNASSLSYGNTYGVNDVIGCAFDADTGKIWWSKNGTWQASGDPAAGTNAAYTGLATGTYYPAVGDGSATQTFSASYNFGQRAFAYTPPSGFLALNTQNLPEPTIKKGSSYFDTVLWTGNGAAGRSITGLNFSPDLVWLKNRSDTYAHQLHDAVRGASAGALYSSLINAQDPNFPLTSFDSAGFTLGNTASLAAQSQGSQNFNGNGFVAWCWDESATPGFDIVTFTGTGATQNISHSLGVAPKMMLVKSRSAIGDWWVYHESIGATKTLFLSLTDAALTFTAWNNTAPTSSVFTVGAASGLNANGVTSVAYLWSEVAGFSKFGSYTGNGSTDGPFVYCGFRPRWIMFKSTTLMTDWIILDTARDSYNQQINGLAADLSNAENASTLFATDAVANGFKIRTPWNNFNQSGQTFIFAAFAETAFRYSLAR